jgi:hypothetical protein
VRHLLLIFGVLWTCFLTFASTRIVGSSPSAPSQSRRLPLRVVVDLAKVTIALTCIAGQSNTLSADRMIGIQ